MAATDHVCVHEYRPQTNTWGCSQCRHSITDEHPQTITTPIDPPTELTPTRSEEPTP